MNRAQGNNGAVNVCIITGKTENFLPASSAKKPSTPMTAQLQIL
jgi:hypothetical protein